MVGVSAARPTNNANAAIASARKYRSATSVPHNLLDGLQYAYRFEGYGSIFHPAWVPATGFYCRATASGVP